MLVLVIEAMSQGAHVMTETKRAGGFIASQQNLVRWDYGHDRVLLRIVFRFG